GGKHNDLEIVGQTARHHTFFEMLGNFSFGDYFKEEAIQFGWKFLTEELCLPIEKLWVTIYLDDDESYNIWTKTTGISPDRIVRLGEKDNFWSMGDTGPCGPCSEILIDRGTQKGCGKADCNVECECDRHLELWNLVFMQYNRDKSGKLSPLPNPSIDTGMGLERVCSVLQSVDTNYETDLFMPIIRETEKVSGLSYDKEKANRVSFRVIADHSRAAAFLIADDILPANEGRGYVLRRIIRRAARHGKMLGINTPFLFRGSGAVVDCMGDVYPELCEKKEFMLNVIQKEEERFQATLDHGLKILEEVIQKAKSKEVPKIPGDDLFKLYDTYGFPLDIAREVVLEAGLEIDEEGFQKSMEHQKTTARTSWKGAEEMDTLNEFASKLAQFPSTVFEGYEKLNQKATILAIFQDGNEKCDLSGPGKKADLLLDSSVLYAESGGQKGDRGLLLGASCEAEVVDTKKVASDYFLHSCTIKNGSLRVGDTVTVTVDKKNRNSTELNHSATHVLHQALREVLGDHVKQAGSYVGSDRLRFDFSHFSAPSQKEVQKIESLVNRIISENLPITTESLSFDEAVGRGAIALFGEKYGKSVRMVKIGDFSTELCGGTHTGSTAKIGLFKIVNEGGISAGVRRIEALTGAASYAFIAGEIARLDSIREVLKAGHGNEEDKLLKILARLKDTERELSKVKEKLVSAGMNSISENMKKVNGISLLIKRLDGTDIKNLRLFVDNAKQKITSGVVVAGAEIDGKVALIVGVTKDLTGRVNAGKIVSKIVTAVNGRGGGRADMAQAGGPNVSGLETALENAVKVVQSLTDE
ncbi:MAG: alanine--tRNA ligase, partial [Nitrospinota bacterium]